MTKVQISFDVARPLDEHLLDCVASAHGIYGIARVVPAPDLRGLVVDYDASRLTADDVEAALRRSGIPVTARP